VEVQEGKLSINGFGSWRYGASTHGNSYELARPDGNFDDGEFGLALSGRLSDQVVVAAQTRVAINVGAVVFIDFLFGEYRFSDLARGSASSSTPSGSSERCRTSAPCDRSSSCRRAPTANPR
jgi:hypothetical protein